MISSEPVVKIADSRVKASQLQRKTSALSLRAFASSREVFSGLTLLCNVDTCQVFDRLTSEGLGITDYVLRLESPQLSDPKTEAEVAQAWDQVQSLTLDEKRDKIGLASLKEALADRDPGKILVMGMNTQVMSLETIELLAGGFTDSGDHADAAQQQLSKLLVGDGRQQQLSREVMAGMVRNIRTVIAKAIEAEGDQWQPTFKA